MRSSLFCDNHLRGKVNGSAPAFGPFGPKPLRRSPLAEWIEEIARRSKRPPDAEPRACVLAAMAMAVAEQGWSPTPASCAKWMPSGEQPPRRAEIRRLGGYDGAYMAIKGGIAFPGGMGGWSPSFLMGLKDSGSISLWGRGEFYVRRRAPVWLRWALSGPLPFVLTAKPQMRGLRAWGCPLADWRVEGHTRERLAGCLAGSTERISGGKVWMHVDSGCGPLLSWAGVKSDACATGLLVSPFFVSLFSPLAPEAAVEWMTRRRSPAGMCPEVAGAFWEMCFGGLRGFRGMVPEGALPYLPRWDNLATNLGWGKRELRVLAKGWWPAGVAGWVRGCGVWWCRKAGLVVKD